jgi:hypothetical protein
MLKELKRSRINKHLLNRFVIAVSTNIPEDANVSRQSRTSEIRSETQSCWTIPSCDQGLTKMRKPTMESHDVPVWMLRFGRYLERHRDGMQWSRSRMQPLLSLWRTWGRRERTILSKQRTKLNDRLMSDRESFVDVRRFLWIPIDLQSIFTGRRSSRRNLFVSVYDAHKRIEFSRVSRCRRLFKKKIFNAVHCIEYILESILAFPPKYEWCRLAIYADNTWFHTTGSLKYYIIQIFTKSPHIFPTLRI